MISKLLAGFAFVCFATSASAGPPPSMTPSQMIDSTFSGYFSVHGGLDAGREDYLSPTSVSQWNDPVFGGAARGVVTVEPGFTIQGDVWTNIYDGHDPSNTSNTWTNNYPGAGVHATWTLQNGDSVGVLGSLGAYSYSSPSLSHTSTFANVGAEGVHNDGNWRWYGQVGMTNAIAGFAQTSSQHDVYAALDAMYFFDPNLVVSANVRGSYLTETGHTSPELAWGARLEYKPEGSPVSLYAQYQGWGWQDNYKSGETGKAIEGAILVGLRVPFGQTTVQDLDKTVGLVDMNSLFGDFAP